MFPISIVLLILPNGAFISCRQQTCACVCKQWHACDVFLVFRCQHISASVIDCSGAHLGLTVGLYMQRFFGRIKQLWFGFLMRTTHACVIRAHLLSNSWCGRWVYIVIGSIDLSRFASTVVIFLMRPCPMSAHGSQALLEFVGSSWMKTQTCLGCTF